MAGNVVVSNNNLIQAKMNYPCANTTLACTANAGISKFSFTSGKKHRLRLIGASGEGMQKFSIDGHNLTVIANDFVPLKPYTTDMITLAPGQRADIIVEGIMNSTAAVWMRSNLTSCSATDGVSTEAVAAIYYEDADTSAIPTTKFDSDSSKLDYCGNDDLSLTVPLYDITPSTPSTSTDIDIEYQYNGTNYVWTMNNVSFHGDYNNPILLQAAEGNTTFSPEW